VKPGADVPGVAQLAAVGHAGQQRADGAGPVAAAAAQLPGRVRWPVLRGQAGGDLPGFLAAYLGEVCGSPADCGRARRSGVTDQHAWSSTWANTCGAVMHTA
jgi:hypothetical protein